MAIINLQLQGQNKGRLAFSFILLRKHHRSHDRNQKNAKNDHERPSDREFIGNAKNHFRSNESQNSSQAVLQIMEVSGYSSQCKI